MFYNYDELNRLKKEKNTGLTIMGVFIAVFFIISLVLPAIPSFTPIIEKYDYLISLYFFAAIVIVLVIYFKKCAPYYNYRKKMNDEIKTTMLKNELNNRFNGTATLEDLGQTMQTIRDLGIKKSGRMLNINDCFSCKYNNIRFKYTDMRIYHSDDDGTVTDFQGPIIEFELNNQIDGTIYIGAEVKVLIAKTSIVSSLIDNGKYKKKNPINSVLNDNIVIKSDIDHSLIENQSFQGAINELINSNQRYVFIIKDNKFYVLIDNHNDSFELNIKTQEDEIKSREKIINDVEALRLELDNIIRFKDALNIKENTF